MCVCVCVSVCVFLVCVSLFACVSRPSRRTLASSHVISRANDDELSFFLVACACVLLSAVLRLMPSSLFLKASPSAVGRFTGIVRPRKCSHAFRTRRSVHCLPPCLTNPGPDLRPVMQNPQVVIVRHRLCVPVLTV